jgi:hypothetical protein
MYKLGCNPPLPETGLKELESSALRIREYAHDHARFERELDACSNTAVAETPKLTGAHWVCEVKKNVPDLIPERRSRKGVAGFGGSIDILASDRSQLWDYKFVSQVPDKIKVAYLWQLASYHILTGIPIAGILFVTRDGGTSVKCRLDFRLEAAAEFAKRVRAFITFTGHADFRSLAWPVKTDACEDWCNHRKRCFAYQDKGLEIKAPVPGLGGLDMLMELTQAARVSPDGKLF